jgi:hypothetical protein
MRVWAARLVTAAVWKDANPDFSAAAHIADNGTAGCFRSVRLVT